MKDNFITYIKKNSLASIIILVMLFICYGKLLFSIYYYQDFGVVSKYFGTTYNWYDIGRYGLVLLRYIFGTFLQNVYYTGFLTLVAMTLVSIFYTYIIEYVSGIQSSIFSIVVFALIMFIHPAWSEQFYFQFQSFEIVFGIFLVELSLYLLWAANDLAIPHLLTYILSIAIAILAFGVYQSMLNIYISSCIAFYFFDKNRKRNWNNLFKDALKYIAIFGISFFIYELIVHKTSTSTYLSNQVAWGTKPISIILDSLKENYIYTVLEGKEALYSFAFTIIIVFSAIIFLLDMIYFCFVKKEKRIKYFVIDLFILLSISASTFLLGFIIGFTPLVRSQLALPLTTALLYMYCINHIHNSIFMCIKKNAAFIILLFSIVSIYPSLTKVTRILYSYDIIAQNSYITATKLSYDLDKAIAEYGDLPLALVGIMDVNIGNNKICVDQTTTNSYMLNSMLNQNGVLDPKYYNGSIWTLEFFSTYGINYQTVSSKDFQDATVIAKDMPIWPAEGSIIPYNGYIIVRIGQMFE